MLEELLAAIISGNTTVVLNILKLVPVGLLTDFLAGVDSSGFSAVHYLARYNQVAALQFLHNKIPEPWFTEEVDDFTPFMMAVCGNARDVVAYFESEKIDHFDTDDERNVFYGKWFLSQPANPRSTADWQTLLSYAVAIGDLETIKILLPRFLAEADASLQAGCQLALHSLAIESHHTHLLPYLTSCMEDYPQEIRLKWLTNRFSSLLPLDTSIDTITYIEKNYDEPAKIINMLFPYDDSVLKIHLIFHAAQKTCPKILKQLLADLKVDDQSRKHIILEIVKIAAELFYAELAVYPLFYVSPDILDGAAAACADDFNHHPEFFANILYQFVEKNYTHCVDIFLRRVSNETKQKALTYQFKDGLNLLSLAGKNKLGDMLAVLNQHRAIEKIDNASLQKKLLQQSIYFNVMNKVIDGETNEAVVEKLVKSVQELRKINSGPWARDLWKALTAISTRNLDTAAQKIYQCFSEDVLLSGSERDSNRLFNHALAFEYGIMLGDYKKAWQHLDHISALAPGMAKNKAVSIKMGMPQVLVARISLIFCEALNSDIPLTIKKMLRQIADSDGFHLQTAVHLLHYVTPRILTIAELEKICDRLAACEEDMDNYKNMSFLNEFIQSPLYHSMAIRTFTNIWILFSWVCSMDKTMLGLDISNAHHTDIDSLKKVYYFSWIKSVVALNLMKASLAIRMNNKIKLPYLTIMRKTYEKMNIFKNEMEDIFAGHDIVKEVVMPDAPVDPLLMWAIKQQDESTVLRLLQLMDKNLLTSSYAPNLIIADYLARQLIKTGQLAAIKLLISKLSFVSKNAHFFKRLLPFAVAENQAEIVEFLEKNEHIDFIKPIYAGAYKGEIPNSISMDASSTVAVSYAVSGGHQATVEKYLSLVLPTSMSYDVLLLRCLRSRNLHLLNLLAPLVSYDDLRQSVQMILQTVNERFDDAISVIQQIIAYAAPDCHDKLYSEFVIAAMAKGNADIMLNLVRLVDNKDKRVRLACSLLRTMADEYQGLRGFQLIEQNNKKRLGITDKGYLIAQRVRTESEEINKTIRKERLIARLARLIANDLVGHEEQLYNVLKAFYAAGYDAGMRDLLSNLPREIAAAAINYIPKNAAHPPLLSLMHTAILQDNTVFWYLLVYFGADLEAVCYPGATQTLSQLIGFRHKTDPNNKPALSSASLAAEQHLQAFLSLLNQLERGESLSEESIRRTVNDIKKAKIKLKKLEECLAELWDTVKWCCKHNTDKTDFNSILLLADVLIEASEAKNTGYLRCAQLVFALGRYDQALSYLQKIQSYDKISAISTIGFITTKMMLILFNRLNIALPKGVARYYLEEWGVMCEREMVDLGCMSFLSADKFNFDLSVLQALLDDLDQIKLPIKMPAKLFFEDNPQTNTSELLKLVQTSSAILALLMDMESQLSALQNKISINVQHYFYLVAKKIIEQIKMLLEMQMTLAQSLNMELYLPPALNEFSDKIETIISKFWDEESSHHDSGKLAENKKTSKKSKNKNRKNRNNNNKRPTLSTPSRSKKVEFVKMTSDEVYSIVPPFTYELEEEVPLQLEAMPKRAAAPFHHVPPDIIDILFSCENENTRYKALLTGGAVRDCLMNKIPADFDIVVYCEPAILQKILQQKFGLQRIEKSGGGKMNSWKVKWCGYEIDFSSITPEKSFEDDVANNARNRDFTCNAIYWHPDIGLIDPLQGKKDIESKVLELVVPDEHVFIKRPVRMFRALRFSRQLGFTFSANMEKAIDSHKDESEMLVYTINQDQLTRQYEKMVKSFNSSNAVNDVLAQYGFFSAMKTRRIIPEELTISSELLV